MHQVLATNKDYKSNYLELKEIISKDSSFFLIEDLVYDLSITDAVKTYYSSSSDQNFLTFYSDFLHSLKDSEVFKHLINAQNVKKTKLSHWKSTLRSNDIEFVGDLHLGITKVKSEKKIYYENLLGYEAFLNDLRNIIPDFSLFFPSYNIETKTISREYVDFKAKKATDTYYFNLGKFIAFALFFRIIDLNYENLLIRDNIYPYFYDLEFMFTPTSTLFPFHIKMTGLLSGQPNENNSALIGGLFPINSLLKPLVEYKNNLPEIVWKRPTNKTIMSQFPEKTHPYKYKNALFEGINAGMTSLLYHKTKIFDLLFSHEFKTRILIRPTRVYRSAFISTVYSKDPFETTVKNLLKNTETLGFSPDNANLLKSEYFALNKLAIPYYFADIKSKEVKDINKTTVCRLHETPLNTFTKHIETYQKFMSFQKRSIGQLLYFNYLKYKKL